MRPLPWLALPVVFLFLGCNRSDSASDPFFPLQWHLQDGPAGAIHIGDAWNTTRGEGVLISLVDDGLQISHEDLSANVRPGAGLNLYVGQAGFPQGASDPSPPDPPPDPMDPPFHGTAVAGVIAARDDNGVGVRGVAPRAALAGINLLASGDDPVREMQAMTHNLDVQAVSSNSWGATDGLGDIAPASQEISDALEQGVTQGLGGLGTVYVWAAGNGANADVAAMTGFETDNANHDGLVNSYTGLTVCAVRDDGKRTAYSEQGANLWICAPAETTTYDNNNVGITTTDISGSGGYNPRAATPPADTAVQGMDYLNGNYSQGFNGTSAATPMVSGAVALMRAVNPRLSWRDVRLILAETARHNDPHDSDWFFNHGESPGGGPYHVNHKYGFGLLDVAAAVARAQTWQPVGPALTPYDSGEHDPMRPFADNTANGAVDSITVSGSGIGRIEYIDVYLSADGDIGDIDVRLRGSAGTESVLAVAHECYDNPDDAMPAMSCQQSYDAWRFGTARHLGEPADQTWSLYVSDRRPGRSPGGTFQSWRLVIRGRAQ